MKTHITLAALALLLLGALPGHAAITVPGADGSDGALNITANQVIDLSEAVLGDGVTVKWDTPQTGANVGKGLYDPAKWAVVFKYSSVTVAAGATVTFKNHPSRAPVVWLVSGDVTINGTVSLVPQTVGYNAPAIGEPGPGGFRGGQGYYASGVGAGSGFGVGGSPGGNWGSGGSYGTVGAADQYSAAAAYGNPSLIPLIGGSGGGGYSSDARGGGAGGGAMLIACASTLSIVGAIRADGGSAGGGNGGGSGGGIRIVSDTLNGSGILSSLGGTGGSVRVGGLGRIRIERVNNSNSITVNPAPSVVPLGPSDNALLWPPSDAPEVKIVAIGGQNIGADPLASFGTFGADATLPQTASTQVVVETTNVEQASQVIVRATPRSNGNYVTATGTVSQVVSTTPLVVRWTATLPVQTGYSAVQVKVIRP